MSDEPSVDEIEAQLRREFHEWRVYWDALTDDERAREIAAMDRHAAEQRGE